MANLLSSLKYMLWLSFLLSVQQVIASRDSLQTTLKKADYYIDEEQKRIDLLDGKEDGSINLRDSATTLHAAQVYFEVVDSIQRLIDSSPFSESLRKTSRDATYRILRGITGRTVFGVKRHEQPLRFLLGELNAIKQNRLYDYLVSNISASLNTIEIFRDELYADSFMLYASRYRPDLVMSNYSAYARKNYSQRVLEQAAINAPVTAKRYFNPNEPVFQALSKSSDPVVKVILEIKDKLSRKTNAFALLDAIVYDNLSLEKADVIGNQPEKYLRAMLRIRAKRHPLAVHSLEAELEIYSLKFVRVLNDLHNERDEVRFASVDNFTPEEIYTLMVYSQEEIFTSTFNGLFKRLMIKLGPVSGYEFLTQVGDNRFRTFIKMAAGFGKLSTFLQSMTTMHRQMLMVKFVSGLEEYSDLSQAVEVADAFGSITDSLVIKILRGAIKYEYIRLKTANRERGTIIYGLLSNLFVEKNVSSGDWFAAVAKQYALRDFDRIGNKEMFAADGVNRWLIYFYDDEDGDASFSTFLKTFTDKNWSIADSGTYVIIKSKGGQPVHIYANKSKHEYEGQEKLEKLFAENQFEPNVMVHRGHSYYAFKTIEKIRENTQVFLLGSCGGYHSISSIIERSPEVSIVSSKQIGTLAVNNPMIKLLAEDIRTGQDIAWHDVWVRLETAVKSNPKAYERYLDYIPPHKNLGAIFIKTYNKITGQE